MEFIDTRLEQLDAEPADMTISDIQVRGVYDVEETGAGFTEEYKAERERESGGSDEVEEPEAAELTIIVWCEDDTWERLNVLRQQRTPFPVSVGPFVFEEMGITNIERQVTGEYPGANEVTIQLREFRELVVQQQSIGGGSGGGGGGSSPGGTPGEVSGPEAGDTSYSGTPTTVPSGTWQQFGTNDGNAFAGELIDVSASGAAATISASGGGWVIENVGLRGQQDGQRRQDNGIAFIGATADSGTSAIRHIYMADGASDSRDSGIFLGGGSGQVEVRRINVQGWPDNAMYASEPNAPANTEFIDCYSANNQTSCYRASNAIIRNCVGVRDSFGTRGNRVLWAWSGGTVEVRDSHLINTQGGQAINAASENGTVQLSGDTHIEGGVNGNVSGSQGSNPDPNAYSSEIPGSPDEAAEGVGAGGGGNGGEENGDEE